MKVSSSGPKLESQSPFRLPPLFGGSRLLVYMMYPNNEIQPHDVVMTAKTGASNFKASAAVTSSAVMKGTMIHKMAAKSLIRDLEEQRSYLHDDKGILIKASNNELKQKIIEISIRHQIMSKHTAFVAVEKREEATEGEMKLRKMEIKDMSDGPKVTVQGSPHAVVSSSSTTTVSHDIKKTKFQKKKDKSDGKFGFFKLSRSKISNEDNDQDKDEKTKNVISPRMEEAPRSLSVGKISEGESIHKESKSETKIVTEPAKVNLSLMREIIKLQKANGSFTLDAVKLFFSGVSKPSILEIFSGVTWSEETELVLATAIVVAFIVEKYKEQSVQWNLSMKKSQAWIKKEMTRLNIDESLDLQSLGSSLLMKNNCFK